MRPTKKVPTLDLHGYKTEDVYDALDGFLRQHANQRQVRVMPGKGTGKVKNEVIGYLQQAKYPWSYERLANGLNNEGVMIVHMQ